MIQSVKYERNVTGSFLKMPVIKDKSIDEKIFLKNKIKGSLEAKKCFIDGVGEYWYDITGMQSLNNYIKIKKLDLDFYKKLVLTICEEIEHLESNLLDQNALVLNQEFIYISGQNEKIKFTFYPGYESGVAKKFINLIEFIMKQIDHENKELVEFIYNIYDKLQENEYSVLEIKKYLLLEKPKKIDEQNEKLIVEDYTAQNFKKANKTIETRPKTITTKELYKGDTIKNEKKEKDEAKETSNSCSKIKKIIFDFLGISEPEKKPKNKSSFKKNKPKLQMQKNWKTPENQEPITPIYPDMEIEEETYTACKTVCLSDYREKPEGRLLYEGLDNLKDILLDKKTCTVGKNPDADVRIEKETISNFHCQISEKNDNYYIEDLNSTNGTKVNGELLQYNKKVKLKSNDIIHFADAKYRFL